MLNNMLLNHQWTTEEIKEEIKKYLKNNSKDTTLQKLWDETKTILRGMFIPIQAHLRKKEKAHKNNLFLFFFFLHLK